jgi:hypothetical protein
MALGIIGLVMAFIIPGLNLALALPAWLMGGGDIQRMRNGHMDRQGEGITQAGRVCGIIGTIVGALICFGYCGLFLLGFMIEAAAKR